MEKTRGATPMIRTKPSAFRTDICGLYQTMGFTAQQQIREGFISLGNGAYMKGKQ